MLKSRVSPIGFAACCEDGLAGLSQSQGHTQRLQLTDRLTGFKLETFPLTTKMSFTNEKLKLIVEDGQLDSAGNYLEHSNDVDLNEVFLLLEKLRASKDSLHIKSECFVIHFQYLSETSFEVEIFDIRDGFWAISEIDMVVARKIVEMVSENEEFGELVPITNEIWGAYGGGEFT